MALEDGVQTQPTATRLLIDVQVVARLLPSEITLLEGEMRTAIYMTGLTRKQWERLPQTLVAYTKDGKLVSFLTLVPFAKNWVELGPVYTLPQYEGQKVMTRLLEKARPFLMGRNVFVTSHNPAFIHLMDTAPDYRDRSSYRKVRNLLSLLLFNLPLPAIWYLLTSRFRPTLIKEGRRKAKLGLVCRDPDQFWIRRVQ